MAKPKSHLLPCVANFTGLSQGGQLINVEVGPRQELYALALTGVPDYREVQPGASFLSSRVKRRMISSLRAWTDRMWSGSKSVASSGTSSPFSRFPMASCFCIVGHAVATPTEPTTLTRTCTDSEGRFKREFLLGDGINRVQITGDGRISGRIL